MKYVVTGGAGFVGNNIVRRLIENNHSVIVIDNLHSGKKSNLSDLLEKIEFYDVDIREFDKLKEICKTSDGIFHEASLTVVQDSFLKQNEYYDVNVKGTENILKIAREFNIKVVFASSSSVYGNPNSIPIEENAVKKPINPYGDTKLQAEHLAEKYAKLGVSVIGLRYFNIYGPGQTISYAGVVTKFLHNIKEQKSLNIFGKGKQIRDFIHVYDISVVNVLAMDSKIDFGFFNIGTGIPISIGELSKIMVKYSKQNLKIIFSEALDGDVEESLADMKLTKEKLKWEAKIKLHDGLKIFFDK
jgi:UDP-glucose 4-epimerase